MNKPDYGFIQNCKFNFQLVCVMTCHIFPILITLELRTLFVRILNEKKLGKVLILEIYAGENSSNIILFREMF